MLGCRAAVGVGVAALRVLAGPLVLAGPAGGAGALGGGGAHPEDAGLDVVGLAQDDVDRAAGAAAREVLLANACVVAQRASGCAQHSAGADVFVEGFRGDGTCASTDKRTLRVRRHAGAAVGALLASRQRDDGKKGARDAKRGFGLHGTLPLSEARLRACLLVTRNLPQRFTAEN